MTSVRERRHKLYRKTKCGIGWGYKVCIVLASNGHDGTRDEVSAYEEHIGDADGNVEESMLYCIAYSPTYLAPYTPRLAESRPYVHASHMYI